MVTLVQKSEIKNPQVCYKYKFNAFLFILMCLKHKMYLRTEAQKPTL